MVIPDVYGDDTLPHNPAALTRLRSWGGDKLLGEMVALFARDVPERLRTAREALGRGDLQAVGRAGHSLKSSSAQMGAQRMQRIAREVETGAESGDPTATALLLDQLDTAFAEHLEWIREAGTTSAP
jgi:two-component system, sensor histidine kinase and response regulator